MSLPLFLLLHGAAIALVALLAFLLGRRVTLRMQFDSGVEAFALSTAIGLGILSLAIFALAAAGWLTRPAVAVTLSIGVLLSFPVWRRWGRAHPRPGKILAWILGTLLVLVVLSPIWQLPLYPPIKWDSISYHLTAARLYVESGSLVFMPYLRFPVFPQANEMLFSLALLFADDITAKLTQFLMMILNGFLLFAWGRRNGTVQTGVWAAALWVGSPLVLNFSASANVDVGLALFVTSGAYCVARWCEKKEASWLVIAGFLCGIAAATKYTGLLFLLLYALWIAWRSSGRRRAVNAILFLAVAALVASPWYVRSALLTGDPMFPFLPELFGYSLWSPEDVAHQKAELASHGMGRSPLSMLLVWWNLGWNQGLFRGPALSSLALVIPIPILFYLRRRDSHARFMAWITLPVIGLWFWKAQIMRYLIPILPLLCLQTAALLDSMMRRLVPQRNRFASALVLVLGAILLLAPGYQFARGELLKFGPPPFTEEQRDRFLTRNLPSYPAYKILRERHGKDYTIYVLHEGFMSYYTDGGFMGDAFGPARASRIEKNLGGGQALYDELRRLGADHFLVSDGAGRLNLPRDEAFRSHFRLVYGAPRVELYHLTE